MFLNLTAVVPVSSRLFPGPERCQEQEMGLEKERARETPMCFLCSLYKCIENVSSSVFLCCSPVKIYTNP